MRDTKRLEQLEQAGRNAPPESFDPDWLWLCIQLREAWAREDAAFKAGVERELNGGFYQ